MRSQRIAVIVNRDSGGGDKAQLVLDAAREHLAAGGRSLDARAAGAGEMGACLEDALSGRPDTVIIAGGDGTVSRALARLVEANVALGIVPLGTMNLVAKDLGVPQSPAEAIRSLADAEVALADVGEVNGALFLHSSAIGLVPRVAREREKVRRAPSWRRRAAHIASGVREALTERTLLVGVSSDEGAVTHRAFGLIIANNRMSENPLTPYRREAMDGGRLAAYLSHHKGRLGLVRYLMTMGVGWWRLDPLVTVLDAEEVRVTLARSSVDVTNDGETRRLRTPLIYRTRPRAIRVLRPVREASARGDDR